MVKRAGNLLLAFGCLLALSAHAENGADPAINRPYAEPQYGEWVERFERPGRELYDRREEIVARLNLKPSMNVADIGAGTGLFTRLFARAVKPGRVYAVDIAKNFVDTIVRDARTRGLTNIVGVVNDQTGAGLPKASIDLAFLADTYHHFEQPQAMLRSIHAALRPGGRLAVIDFKREPGRSSAWVMGHVRADQATVVKEIEAGGFKLVRDEDLLRENYFLVFSRP